MKKSSLRAFGIACFIIGFLITFSQNTNLPFISSPETKMAEQYKTEIVQLEQQLKAANEQLSSLEGVKDSQQATEAVVPEEKQLKEETELADSQSAATDEVVTETLYIYAGLTPAEVAQKLKDMEIIANSVEMELFLAQPEYATSIQKGQFQLSSTMSIEEIANIITGQSDKE
ncbi:hypothetical protein [Ureibacillus aquaedulcis]|uniref:YceG-like family protein n=1 Tax=Ureibacillus aquaedulcis TaxID=3058421 RepID=A0ABT8GPG4_9BACL|nr:hypothetical protein [Ureibacillus sp. BA0131]MDN4493302.1 hypothetical protein [Ureibacillus sp. BA0131]